MRNYTTSDFTVGEPVFFVRYNGIIGTHITYINQYTMCIACEGNKNIQPWEVYKANDLLKYCLEFLAETKKSINNNVISEQQKKAKKFFEQQLWLIYYINSPKIQTNPDTPIFHIEKVCTNKDKYSFCASKFFEEKLGEKVECDCFQFVIDWNKFMQFMYASTTHLTTAPKITFDKRTRICDREDRYWFGVDKVVYNMRNERVGIFNASINFNSSIKKEYFKNWENKIVVSTEEWRTELHPRQTN